MSVAERFWYTIRPAHLLLYPLSLAFRAAVAVRSYSYKRGWLRSERLRVPIIVVGNITVGGTGKTPLVLWLAHLLRKHGYRPGIVTRGYGGNEQVQPVSCNSDARDSGDEALLLARRSDCPVWAGGDRVAACRALLGAHPECDILISDDGLQHYRLQRDVEIALVDTERRFGNGLMLPAGPLREPIGRLKTVQAVVRNEPAAAGESEGEHYWMRLRGERLVNMIDATRVEAPSKFAVCAVHAVAGIGNPQRFFAHLRSLGLTIRPHPFPDHYQYTAEDFVFAKDEPVVMTEKDAVKCFAFAYENFWYLPVEAEVDPR